ncbi:MAG: hypothetical protein PHW72_03485 [Candidatus Pacebacteria bacterium]|nr:hypothetical protein [Candidatus Paceibacterota bacterium]
MIPIVSLFNLVSALFFGGISVKLYSSYKKSNDENLKDFFYTFLYSSIMFIIMALPGTVSRDLVFVGLIYAVYPLFSFLSLSYFGQIPLRILSWQKVRKLFSVSMKALGFLVVFIDILNWGPAVFHQQQPFAYWEDSRGEAMNIFVGSVLGLSFLLIFIFFIIQGMKSSERYLKIRAFLIAGGVVFIILGSLINFVFGASALEYIDTLISSLFIVFSTILISAGVYYKPKSVS